MAGGDDLSALFETEDIAALSQILQLATWPIGLWEIDIAEYQGLGPLENP